MNYLAHARLSFKKPAILTGNLISDFVKGKEKLNAYPTTIQWGITLHRAIDSYTDTHPATKEAKEIFRPAYRLYSGAMVDVVYDHFLATDENEFANNELADFAANTYQLLEEQQIYFPPKFAAMFPYMKQQNWLFNYKYNWGMEKSMQGLVSRSQYLTESKTAFLLFEKNYVLLQRLYKQFWPDIKEMASLKLQELENT
jgi:acyl carrier protein phosphodiesterase